MNILLALNVTNVMAPVNVSAALEQDLWSMGLTRFVVVNATSEATNLEPVLSVGAKVIYK